MLKTKTNKMMEREWTNEEKEKQTNETQISKSLNLKSKSKPISFQPINKEKQRRGTPERQRGNEPAGWVRKRWTEKDTREREKVIEEKERRRERVNLIILNSDSPFYPPWIFFFNLSLKSSLLDLTFNRSRVQWTRLPSGFFFIIILIHVRLKYLRWGVLILLGSRVW